MWFSIHSSIQIFIDFGEVIFVKVHLIGGSQVVDHRFEWPISKGRIIILHIVNSMRLMTRQNSLILVLDSAEYSLYKKFLPVSQDQSSSVLKSVEYEIGPCSLALGDRSRNPLKYDDLNYWSQLESCFLNRPMSWKKKLTSNCIWFLQYWDQ